MAHEPFNMAKGYVVDDLHCLYLGVVKQLLTFWFGKKHKQYGFSIRTKVYTLHYLLPEMCFFGVIFIR